MTDKIERHSSDTFHHPNQSREMHFVIAINVRAVIRIVQCFSFGVIQCYAEHGH